LQLAVPPHGLLSFAALRELHIDDLQQHRFGLFWAPLMHATTVHLVERGEERAPPVPGSSRSSIASNSASAARAFASASAEGAVRVFATGFRSFFAAAFASAFASKRPSSSAPDKAKGKASRH
jgi:hypothetical protein